ncbi:MAG TPA: KamA family radical SAM protein [Myxococcales bacterium]|nr:KamA family radical SAM protein [Myxococcales bacterium]
MTNRSPLSGRYTREELHNEARALLGVLEGVGALESARRALYEAVGRIQYGLFDTPASLSQTQQIRARDCANVLRGMLLPRSAKVAGFDMAQALWDVQRGAARDDLQPGFWADVTHLVEGLFGRAPSAPIEEDDIFDELTGREAAIQRSADLDALWERVERHAARFESGLSETARARRAERKRRVLEALGGTEKDWSDWRWQRAAVLQSVPRLAKAVKLSPEALGLVERARQGHLPFGVTPYYASLMDDDPEAGRDRAIRAQVLPTARYVEAMVENREQRGEAFDFMGEHDTSPIDLITRRYPAIVILKPFNSCPQICTYCQRNWEIDDASSCHEATPEENLDKAIAWIEDHPAIHDVLVTGGDPLSLGDDDLERLLGRLAKIPHLDLIRIGTRTPVTMPMRITEPLAAMLGRLREPGRRDVAVVTHFEHVYEITDEAVAAVDRLKRNGLSVYNQHVYNFFVSRRFESVALRMLLRRVGIDPYYTFVPKGKEELSDYRVPIARILQERKEEARLIPGMRRTDEPVYNVPRLGKNHIRAMQHRDLLAIRGDGARVYEFHPWEKNIVERDPYVAFDAPILDYLERLAAIGEDPGRYVGIWYYF